MAVTDEQTQPGVAARSFALDEPIPDARLCFDDTRLGGVTRDFRAQLTDEDTQILRVVDMRRAPDGREHLPMSDNTTNEFREQREEVEFLWRELDRAAIPADEPFSNIDDESVDFHPRGWLGVLRRVTKRGAQPGNR